jgi:hypothetical protein
VVEKEFPRSATVDSCFCVNWSRDRHPRRCTRRLCGRPRRRRWWICCRRHWIHGWRFDRIHGIRGGCPTRWSVDRCANRQMARSPAEPTSFELTRTRSGGDDSRRRSALAAPQSDDRQRLRRLNRELRRALQHRPNHAGGVKAHREFSIRAATRSATRMSCHAENEGR